MMIATATMMTIKDEEKMEIGSKWNVNGTRTTPWVYLDSKMGILELRGNSSPENAINFYDKIYTLIDQVEATHTQEFKANFTLNYFNTSSAKCLFDVFRKLNQLEKKGVHVTVNWHFEEDDEDMLESGEDYADICGLQNFNLVAVSE